MQSELEGLPVGTRVLEIGCGNGVCAGRMQRMGLDVTAIDPSPTGIDAAGRAFPHVRFHVAGVADELPSMLGQFPVVVSVEVIEHCYSPADFARSAFNTLEPGGTLLLSTPYHGYVKNLVLAATGRMDAHYGALWEGGHIKFFSPATITKLLTDHGFRDVRIARVGRIPVVAKSMVVVARRPS
jgi:2-polyprenyl-6-hydroxyphenyl methylase/3-demethylubiquinone-9 3-methyltransferase